MESTLKELSFGLSGLFCLFLTMKIKQTPVSQYLKKELVFLSLFFLLHKNPGGHIRTKNSIFHLEFLYSDLLRPMGILHFYLQNHLLKFPFN